MHFFFRSRNWTGHASTVFERVFSSGSTSGSQESWCTYYFSSVFFSSSLPSSVSKNYPSIRPSIISSSSPFILTSHESKKRCLTKYRVCVGSYNKNTAFNLSYICTLLYTLTLTFTFTFTFIFILVFVPPVLPTTFFLVRQHPPPSNTLTNAKLLLTVYSTVFSSFRFSFLLFKDLKSNVRQSPTNRSALSLVFSAFYSLSFFSLFFCLAFSFFNPEIVTQTSFFSYLSLSLSRLTNALNRGETVAWSGKL